MKKIGAIAFCLLGSGAIIGYYFWNRVTYLPEWYSQDTTTTAQAIKLKDTAGIEAAKAKAVQKIQLEIEQKNARNISQSQGNTELEVALNSEEINALVISQLAENPQGKTILSSAKGLNTTIQNDRIEVGAIVNSSQIPLEELSDRQKEVFDRATATFPMFKNRDIYVSLEGNLGYDQGKLQFDQNTKVKVGNVSLTVTELSERLGIPPEKMTQILELQLNEFNISHVQLKNSEALLTIVGDE